MGKNSQNKKLIILLVGLFLLTGIGTVTYFRQYLIDSLQNISIISHLYSKPTSNKAVTVQKPEKKVWLNIFVHGTFGSTLGLLSPFNVVQDNVKGSTYHKVIKMMRKNNHFYKDQPILQRGLIKLNPSFNTQITGGKKFAAYPLLKAYHTIYKNVFNNNNEEHHFYTFGWTGLISQTSRRLESIRLYNSLQTELDIYEKRGITPKVRIIGHSHAGNLILNLSLINEILFHGIEKKIQKTIESNDKHEAITLMHKALIQLKEKAIVKNKKSQKQWDYFPKKDNLIIDDLIMYGCPIQPETDHCVHSETFKTVYNFYSDEDIVQTMDWASTKRYYSDQRLSTNLELNDKNRVIQAKIMIDKNLFTKKYSIQKKQSQPSFWQRLFSGNSFFAKQSNDPSHKELWFFSWKDKINTKTLAPLPIMVLTPLFLHALNTITQTYDVDINLTIDSNKIIASVIEHNTTNIIRASSMSADILQKIKAKALAWKPSADATEQEFNLIHKYQSLA